MSDFRVTEVSNKLVTHCLTWSAKRAQHWIDNIDLNLMMDKTLTRDCFMIQFYNGKEWVDYV